jgi:nicotinamidase-related amidase
MNTALLIIDIQNDYFPEGKNPLEGSLEAAQKARLLLEYFRQTGLPVFHIRHTSIRPGATFFLPGTPGMEIHESVHPGPAEQIIPKNFPNSFRNTNLETQLRQNGTERLVICGMMTHMCVDATVRAASDLGFECWLADDACATKTLRFDEEIIPAHQVHLAFLAALKGTCAQVCPVDQMILKLSGE